MSECAIDIRELSKQYRLFARSRYRLLDALGFPVPRSAYQELWALQDVTFSVPAGQRLGIIGGNGSGKSTLLKIVAGLLQPTVGAVTVHGEVQALIELGTGFHPEFTGRQNVLAALAYRGITGREAQRRFDEVVEFSELEEFIDNPLRTYSAGMQARLAFSVATAINPEILIIDEVLGAGDAYFAGKCFERMKELTIERGATVLFVSHDLNAVQALCQRVIWLRRGRVVQDGDPLSVARAYYREVQEEENVRLQARARGITKREMIALQEKPLTSAETAALSASAAVRTVYRVVFQPENCSFDDGPRIAAIRVCDGGHRTIATLDLAQDNSEGLRLTGQQAWDQPRWSNGRFSRVLRKVEAGEDAGIEFSLPISRDALLSDCRLVLMVLPSRRFGVRILFDWDGTPEAVGEIFPTDSPQWDEVSFGFGLLANLDKQSDGQESGRSRHSLVTWQMPDPRIEHVHILNSSLRPVTGIQEGDALLIEVSYFSSAPVANPVFGMSIYLLDGKPFCRALNTIGGVDIPRIHGHGKVRFVFSPFYGGPGEYVLSVSIYKHLTFERHEKPIIYDAHDRAYRFRVWKELGNVAAPVLVRAPYRVEHVVVDATTCGSRHD